MNWASTKYGYRPVTPESGSGIHSFKDKSAEQRKKAEESKRSLMLRYATCEGCGLQMEIRKIAKEIYEISTPHWYHKLHLLCEPCCEVVATGEVPRKLKAVW